MKKRKLWIPALLVFLSVILNILARLSRGFSDFYVNRIFPVWVETYGRFTGLFPFSVGEWLLYLAVCLLGLFLLGGVIYLAGRRRLPKEYKSGYQKYALFLYWVFGIVCVIMMLNCFLLYQASPITQRFQIAANSGREYGADELGILRDYVVERADELSACFDRDESGYIVYDLDLAQEAVSRMQQLGRRFPNLKGYYPEPKKLYLSGFYSQQYIMGYYFPFSMEANYNDQMYITNVPVTMCHELSHLKGFILEDEANFIGYLACVDSEDVLFQYSAYLSVIGYLDRDFYQAIGQDSGEYARHVPINDTVQRDKIFLTGEAWQQVEEKAVLDTEVVKQAADTFLNTTLTLNGVSDGTMSYSRVVELLLQYYDGILY